MYVYDRPSDLMGNISPTSAFCLHVVYADYLDVAVPQGHSHTSGYILHPPPPRYALHAVNVSPNNSIDNPKLKSHLDFIEAQIIHNNAYIRFELTGIFTTCLWKCIFVKNFKKLTIVFGKVCSDFCLFLFFVCLFVCLFWVFFH